MQTTPPPTGFTHPTDVMKMKKPRQPFEWGRYAGALLRWVVPGGLLAAVILAFLPPRDVPPPVAPDEVLAKRLSSLVAASSVADGARAFSIPSAHLGVWLVSSVALKEQDGPGRLKPVRVYAVPGDGDVRVGIETELQIGGLPLYFEGIYQPVPQDGGYGLKARRLSVGRLPLPSVAGLLVQKQLDSLSEALAVPLEQLAGASQIGITPDEITLRWSGPPR